MIILPGWARQDSVQLPSKWLKMVDITIDTGSYFMGFLNQRPLLRGPILKDPQDPHRPQATAGISGLWPWSCCVPEPPCKASMQRSTRNGVPRPGARPGTSGTSGTPEGTWHGGNGGRKYGESEGTIVVL